MARADDDRDAPDPASLGSGLAALRGRRVVLGVSGGIAAYKACEVLRGRPEGSVAAGT